MSWIDTGDNFKAWYILQRYKKAKPFIVELKKISIVVENLDRTKLLWIISILFFALSILNYFFNFMGIVQWFIVDILNFIVLVFLLFSKKSKNKLFLSVIILIMIVLIMLKDYFLIQSINSMFDGM